MSPRQAAVRRQFVQVRDSASGDLDGETFVVRTGEVFASDHPIVVAFPHLFRPLVAAHDRPQVEQMTAGPGERRGEQ